MRIKVCKISYQAGCLYRATFIELRVENKAIVSRYVKIEMIKMLILFLKESILYEASQVLKHLG